MKIFKKTVLSLRIALFLVLAAAAVSIIFGCGSAHAAAGPNIAVVNMQAVVAQSNQGKAAQSGLKALYNKYNAELMGMRKHIASLQADLKNNGSIMSADEKAKKTREFETDITNFQSEEKRIQGVMTQKRYELLKTIVDKASGIIESMAKKDGYIIVIDKPGVVYNEPSIDITNRVLIQMNAK